MKQIQSLEDYKKLITEEMRPIIIDVFADWCGPCKAIAPFFEKLEQSELSNHVCFVKFNVEDCDELSQLLGVVAMPTFIGIKNREKVEECRGANKESITNLIKKIL